MNKLNKDVSTKKAMIGYINTLLHNFNLCIKFTQERTGGKNKSNFYKLEHINNIKEIIYYRNIKNLYKFTDNDNIFKVDEKTFIYNELFNKNKNEVYKDDDIFKHIDNGLVMDI